MERQIPITEKGIEVGRALGKSIFSTLVYHCLAKDGNSFDFGDEKFVFTAGEGNDAIYDFITLIGYGMIDRH